MCWLCIVVCRKARHSCTHTPCAPPHTHVHRHTQTRTIHRNTHITIHNRTYNHASTTHHTPCNTHPQATHTYTHADTHGQCQSVRGMWAWLSDMVLVCACDMCLICFFAVMQWMHRPVCVRRGLLTINRGTLILARMYVWQNNVLAVH